MKKILFFDGVCAMCNGLVKFTLRHDKHAIYQYAALQSLSAKEYIPKYTRDLDTVVLLDNNNIYTHSDAIIKLLYGLGGYFKLIILLKIFPKKFRDIIYRMIAKNRYRWFGKTDQCILLSNEEKNRILE